MACMKMTDIHDDMDYWRVVDLGPRKKVRSSYSEELPPQIGVDNPWDHMRVNSFVQSAPRPRQMLSIDELEAIRQRIYGDKVYLTGADIFGKLKNKVLSIPARDPQGNKMIDPITK